MGKSNVHIGIIGYGYWGQNIVRNFFHAQNCVVVCVAESRQEGRDLFSRTYPTIPVVRDADDVINDPSIDAIVVATPVSTHYLLAKKALLQGKHVLVEKPMTPSVAEAAELIELAAKKQLTLMVDHTFLYTGAVQKIRQLIDANVIGRARYFDSTRINLGLFQPDINVLWDLAAHDLSILVYLIREEPVSVHATGISHTKNGIENIAYMTLHYNEDFIAHFHCSWSSPVKIRQTLIGGDEKMIIYNDIEPTEKVKIYDTGYNIKTEEDKKQMLVDYRTGDVNVPKISTREALSGVAADFIQSIIHKSEPLASAASGLKVVRILEASQQSIKNKGRDVQIT
ncbi:Gfo/Idh/MocA family oxidoreductase [Terrimonas sp. NA20]|uniref:Gfo/Idh/MocA family oxidoreductase n=1 Tax=Terrimonas ginsenosidimutans TaxID=2908004 RepID=A0ABS9KPA9_9BACT|nr:Gfo/Idh/MocA family oxidoreductase [Terrimonas ginsenosidimutans]MCG2614168.1 Gfo/Idh/MocA family oxidoreductase [Terrimonas ginsenosidimutans]